MDLEPAIALVSTVAGSAASAAGGQAWQSLVDLFRRATGRTEPEPVDPGDAEGVRVLVGQIVDRARRDEEFGAQLRQWAERHRGEVRNDVHNTVSGDARIDGPVIQTRDIHGGISFG